MEDLQNVFAVYCNGEPTMDGKSFAKLAKDTKLLDGRLTATDVDLTFAKVKDKTARRITYQQFLDGLDVFAQKKGVGAEAVQAKVAKSKGPVLSGTVAEANKFHDDKSLYTGVHAKGGPSTIDTDKVHDISQIMDRSDADVRGVSVNYQSGAARTSSGNVMRATSSAGRAPQTGSMRQSQDGALPRMDSMRRSGSNREMLRAESTRKLALARPGTGSSRNLMRTPSSKTMVAQPSGSLAQVFQNFTNGAPDMDGRQFAKFAKDTGVVNKKCTPTDIDLIFAKVKGNPSARKISYMQFVDGVEHCASKRGGSYEDLEQKILQSGGPTFSGTVAEANKFHDDKSLYTGVYANGGPSTIDTDKVHDISQIMDRSDADVRGVSVNYQPGAARTNSGNVARTASNPMRASTGSSRNLMSSQGAAERSTSSSNSKTLTGANRSLARGNSSRAVTAQGPRVTRTASGRELLQSGSGRDLLRSSSGRRLTVNEPQRPQTGSFKSMPVQRTASSRTMVSGPAGSLKEVFNNFCGVEAEMDGRQFAKFAKDCGVVNRQCTPTDIDLIFAKIKDGPSARRISYQQFLLGIEHCAARRGDDMEDLQRAILAAGGPAFSGTVASANKFHDDKSLYTGTHAGSMLVSRTESRKNLRDSMEVTRTESGQVVTDGLKKKVFGNELKQVFADYCDKDEASMDGKYFAKLAKDCQLVGPGLTETDLDLTFAKIKERDSRRINYAQFLDGLAIFAQKKGVTLEEIKALVAQSQGPILYGTVAEANKFHDDKSLYTGTHGGTSTVKRAESRKNMRLSAEFPKTADGREATPEVLKEVFGNELKQVFTDYCDRDEHETMDNKYFTKLAKDCQLLDNTLQERDCDIAFAKVKSKEARRIAYPQFLEGLAVLASKKGMDLETMKKIVAASDGPILYGTVAEKTRFHDDKSLYTGMHAGGDGMAERSESRRNLQEGMGKTKLPNGEEVTEGTLRKIFGNDVKDVFEEYCDAQGTMDGKYFNKLAKDCELVGGNLKERDVDLAFAKIKERDARRITYMQFLEGLVIFANKRGVSVEEIKAQVMASEGMVLKGTFAEANKFHDDKSLYTGSHSDSKSLRDRTESRKSTAINAILTPDGEEATPALLKKVFGNDLRQAFGDYCDKEDSMDNKYFTKLAKDIGMVGGGLKEQDCDLAFAKVKDKEARRISYMQFLQGLVVLATKKGMSLEEVHERVSASQGPILTGTVAEKNKFHDDKSLYTGVHAYGGPSTLDTDKVTDLSRHLDRSPADVRGVSQKNH